MTRWGGYPDGERYALRKDLAALRQMASWLVVVQTVVVHCDRGKVATRGLFGLLCDAPVQIVDVAEVCRVEALFQLARDCEDRYRVAIA